MSDIERVIAWLDALADKEHALLESGRCNNVPLTQERWLVYKAIALDLRDGLWNKPVPQPPQVQPRDPDDTDQPCPHGDYRSCVVDGCVPLRRVHEPGVIVPPPALVSCMWCGGDSPRGQCAPCAALLEALQAAPSAGVSAILETWSKER
jgi:hypothetical protein